MTSHKIIIFVGLNVAVRIRHLVELWRLHRHTRPRLARRRALGEHVKMAFAPFIVRSRLYDLVACDEIIFYLELSR